MRAYHPDAAAADGASSAAGTVRVQGEVAGAFESALYAMRCAQMVVEAFLSYDASFRVVTRHAQVCFAARDWHRSHDDAVERIELYEQSIRSTVAQLELALGDDVRHRGLWRDVKRHFSNLIGGLPDSEFCKTFFSSVTRRLFGTVGVTPDIEFVATDLDPLCSARASSVVRRYAVADEARLTLREMLGSRPLGVRWADLEASAYLVASAIERVQWKGGQRRGLCALEIVDAVFYQSTRAYLIGRVVGEGFTAPLAIALRNTDLGVMIDSTMLTEDELSILFGFARSYFHVDLEHVADTVAFLRELIPRKQTGELFTVLGRAKQGKTERYRNFFRHLGNSRDQFIHAPGQKGLVMVCFTLPSYEVVFKVIRDRIPDVKTVSRRDVMAKYSFVFLHDRAGRLIDAQEFRRLRFPLARFSPALLEELQSEAANSVHREGDDLIIDHCYIERRVTPLDVYLLNAPAAAACAAAIDYGRAIRDLAYTNVFPGDLLLKNFGVTRHGRVVFYDYDELCRVTDCQFRDLPTPTNDEDEMRGEPWFYVGEQDIFPETFLNFLGMSGEQREEFLQVHNDLFEASFWRRTQQRLAAGEVLEVLPYVPKPSSAA